MKQKVQLNRVREKEQLYCALFIDERSKHSDRVICTFYGSDLCENRCQQRNEKFFLKIDVFSTDNELMVLKKYMINGN